MFAETIGLDEKDVAVLCELMLRGPQTVGELRTRGERLHPFADLAAVQIVLDGLMQRPAGSLVARLARQAGRKECRYAHLLCGPVAVEESTAPAPAMAPTDERIAQLEKDVADLRAELAGLRGQFEKLHSELGGTSPEAP
jgi:hypothetical protein